MNNRTTILNELKELAPTLASIGTALPYQVPGGYFDQLPERVLQLVKEPGNVLPGDLSKENPYGVPGGYFENFASDMLKKVKALDAGSSKEEIEIISPLLQGLQKQQAFEVPEGYFSELTDNVLEGAKAIAVANEALENLSPLMIQLKGSNVYEVPVGYFENLPDQILEKASTKQPARVVTMKFTRKVMRLAVAAVIAGLCFTAAWWVMNSQSRNPDQKFAKDIKKISDKDLLEYQSTEAPVDVVNVAVSDDIDEADMKEMLAEISDEELQQYTDQNTGNNQTITN